jgi:ribosome-associated protein
MAQALKDIIINALEEVKATEITAIDVRDLTGITDTMIIASGNSNRQVKALANSVVVDAKEAGYEMIGIEGDDKAEWVLVDFGDVIVHVMLPATRVFYDIERLWSVRPNDTEEG